MLDEMSISSSSSLSSFSSDFDDDESDDKSDDKMLVDEIIVALAHQSAIANRLTQTIAHPNIVWRTKNNGLTIQELSEDDALSYFRLRKEHLQIVADVLWPRLAPHLLGEKENIKIGDGPRFSCRYETLLLLMIYRLSRPCRIHRDMESFFGFRRIKICAGIRVMIDAMYTLAVKYLDNPIIFNPLMPSRYAKIINKKMWVGHECAPNVSANVPSKCDAQWSQTLPWDAFAICYDTRWPYCLHVWCYKWR
jgi:hypothetical protein